MNQQSVKYRYPNGGPGERDGVCGLAEVVAAGTVPVVFCRTDPKEKGEKWPD